MLVYIFLFITGLCFGSFYNVLALRLCKNESIIAPRSHCVNCDHQLSWYELIPIISYISLRGRCKKCHQHISFVYPVVELISGLLFVFSYILYGFNYLTLISIVISSIVVITFITDTIYMIILDEILFGGIIILLIIYLFFEGPIMMLKHLLNALIIFLVFFLIKYIGDRAFKQESLGWGDVKLSIISGLVLGPYMGIVFLILASFLAFPYAIYVSFRRNEMILPFGPFLATSLLVVFWNINFLEEFFKILMGG